MNDSQNSIQSKKLDPKDVAKLRVLDALENESLNFAQVFCHIANNSEWKYAVL